MAVNVETLGTLERRVSMSLPVAEVDRQVEARLKKLARTVKMPGFRPGRVPLKLVAQHYGSQVRNEVISDAVQKAFGEMVREARLRVAGLPRIEKKDGAADRLEFSATFEVFPEVKVGDLTGVTIERPVCAVDDAAVEKTIQILRRQRVRYEPVTRAAADGDRVTIDFEGRIDGQPFEGGAMKGFVTILGEKRLLPEFEAAARGLAPGEERAFEVRFPDDYHGREVAGKTAQYSLRMVQVEAPVLPEVDAEFARALGVADGDLARMRAEVRANVEREVKKRIALRVKQQAFEALLERTPLELPRALVAMELQRLLEAAAADLKARGVKLENLPLDPRAFEAAARRRAALGLILAEVARAENLRPKPADVRAQIEAEAESYENPAEVVKWFYTQPQRLAEMESLALEANVVAWVLARANVTDKAVSFDELMGADA
ncbi:MAG: trigger factor [Burkholderiales bacterium]|nr:trigger factor [Burkholderiales bacterium]